MIRGVEARTVSVDEQLPMTLARLHWDMPVGTPLTLEVDRGDPEGEQVDRLRDLVVGAGFAVDDVAVEDLVVRHVPRILVSRPRSSA